MEEDGQFYGTFGIFYGHAILVVDIWYSFFPFWYGVPRKIWQPCSCSAVLAGFHCGAFQNKSLRNRRHNKTCPRLFFFEKKSPDKRNAKNKFLHPFENVFSSFNGPRPFVKIEQSWERNRKEKRTKQPEKTALPNNVEVQVAESQLVERY
jgi:hypothetical protein